MNMLAIIANNCNESLSKFAGSKNDGDKRLLVISLSLSLSFRQKSCRITPPQIGSHAQNSSRIGKNVPTHLVLAVAVATGRTTGHLECEFFK